MSYSFFPPPAYLVMGLALSWLFFQKLKHHKSMLDRMSEFDFRNAKCTLETDRLAIEEQVLSLFDEALEPAISVAFDAEMDTEAEAVTALLPVLYLCDCLILSQRAILTVTMVKFSPLWLGALVVSVLLDFGLVWFLFFWKQHPSTSQTQRALVR